jgi:prevent-host-death family protein
MRTMSAKDAKNHFGELLMEAQKAPVTIEKNGKPVAVVYSMEWHEAAEEAKLEWLKRAVAEAKAGDEVLDVPFDQDLVDELFAEFTGAAPVR